jgi:hypothetical protein
MLRKVIISTAAVAILTIVGALNIGDADAKAQSDNGCQFARMGNGNSMVRAQVCNVTPGQQGDVVVQAKTVLPAEVVLCFNDGGPYPACSHISNVTVEQRCLSFTISWPAERVIGMDNEGNLLFAPMPPPQWIGLRDAGDVLPYAINTLSKPRHRQFDC